MVASFPFERKISQCIEVGDLTNLRRKFGQPVSRQVQVAKALQLRKFGDQGGEAVVREGQRFQAAQVSETGRQFAEQGTGFLFALAKNRKRKRKKANELAHDRMVRELRAVNLEKLGGKSWISESLTSRRVSWARFPRFSGNDVSRFAFAIL